MMPSNGSVRCWISPSSWCCPRTASRPISPRSSRRFPEPGPRRVGMLTWVRVALISRVDRAVAGLAATLRVVGHEPVGALTTTLGGSRYGADSLGGITSQAGDGFDVVVAGSRSRIAPLLAAL